MIDFSHISLPFSISDLLSTGNGLLAIIGGFVLLSLSFKFTPMIINIIKNSIGYYNYYNFVKERNGDKPSKYDSFKRAIGKGIDYRHERW